MFLRIKWFTNDSPSGSVSVSNLQVFGCRSRPHLQVPVVPGVLVVIALLAKNLVRGAIGREWMAIRDMDVAAAVIGIRPMYAKLSAFAVSSFIIGVAGALWASSTWAPGSRRPSRWTSRSAAVHGDHRRHGLHHGQLLRCGLHRDPADFLNQALPLLGGLFGHGDVHRRHLARRD
jgi:hypothetical protein